jgi:hypothetical protein
MTALAQFSIAVHSMLQPALHMFIVCVHNAAHCGCRLQHATLVWRFVTVTQLTELYRQAVVQLLLFAMNFVCLMFVAQQHGVNYITYTQTDEAGLFEVVGT